MKPFFTKKQKKLMRERRKKKRLYEKQSKGDKVDEGVTVTDHQQDDNDNHDEQEKTRKRSYESISPEKNDTANASSPIIVVPSHLSAKEAKKFRKDARRSARAQGRDDSKFVFLSEEEFAAQNSNAKRRKQQQHQKFPNLNELVEEQKRQQERKQQEEARRKAEEDLPDDVKQRYVALDCEMVGIGSSGKQSALARASLTDWNGKVLMDSFVQVPLKVTDFRTKYSGVLPRHISSRKAITVEECRKKVTDLLRGKILVGHALKNDLQALMLTHPPEDTRDTAKYRPYQRLGGDGRYRPRKLRDLVAEHCDITIQRPGESHDSVDDARATMELFKVSRVAWEAAMERKYKKGKST